MKNEFTRRHLIGRAGIALGGAVALGALACGSDESDPQPEPQPQEGPQVADFPYEKHLAADFRLDVAALKEAAYHAYYAGGCCHGAYSALLGDLNRAGAPFTLLPLDFGKFGGGGIASYGSICGAVLGGVLVTNMIVQNPTTPPAGQTKPQDVRANLLTELMRWYETFELPAYVPQQVDAKEHANGDPSAALATTLPFGTESCRREPRDPPPRAGLAPVPCLGLRLVRSTARERRRAGQARAMCPAHGGRRREDRGAPERVPRQ